MSTSPLLLSDRATSIEDTFHFVFENTRGAVGRQSGRRLVAGGGIECGNGGGCLLAVNVFHKYCLNTTTVPLFVVVDQQRQAGHYFVRR